MPTVSVNLSTTEYVQVNTALNPMMLQCLRDSVRITLSEAKPAKSNTVFHLLSGGDDPLPFNSVDTNVWALAVTDKSSLIVSEVISSHVQLVDSTGTPLNTFKGGLDVHEKCTSSRASRLLSSRPPHCWGTETRMQSRLD